MVDIMSQTSYESISGRNRRDLDQRHAAVSDELSQERNMQFQGGYISVGSRLTHSQKAANLTKQVIADPGSYPFFKSLYVSDALP
jgi:hypothetical protein